MANLAQGLRFEGLKDSAQESFRRAESCRVEELCAGLVSKSKGYFSSWSDLDRIRRPYS